MRPIKFKPKPKEHQVTCFCGSPMRLVFTDRFGGSWFYECRRKPMCKGRHTCHQDSGAPTGTPADSDTRKWRIKAHARFDSLWKGAGGIMNRKTAYEWLTNEFNLDETIHIGHCSAEMCRKIIEKVNKKRGIA